MNRGDTIYDVIIPKDAEVIECENKNCPYGVFRMNKNNIDECSKEFEDMSIDKRNNKDKFSYNDLWEEAKEIYNILLNIKISKKY